MSLELELVSLTIIVSRSLLCTHTTSQTLTPLHWCCFTSYYISSASEISRDRHFNVLFTTITTKVLSGSTTCQAQSNASMAGSFLTNMVSQNLQVKWVSQSHHRLLTIVFSLLLSSHYRLLTFIIVPLSSSHHCRLKECSLRFTGVHWDAANASFKHDIMAPFIDFEKSLPSYCTMDSVKYYREWANRLCRSDADCGTHSNTNPDSNSNSHSNSDSNSDLNSNSDSNENVKNDWAKEGVWAWEGVWANEQENEQENEKVNEGKGTHEEHEAISNSNSATCQSLGKKWVSVCSVKNNLYNPLEHDTILVHIVSLSLLFILFYIVPITKKPILFKQKFY